MSAPSSSTAVSLLAANTQAIDHLAIAVPDLESAIETFVTVLGFSLKERRKTEGKSTSMISAVMEAGPLQIVLLQGTDNLSQVSRFVEEYGPGVQHVAIRVNDIEAVSEDLRKRGMEFDTSIITGGGLRQIFSRRDASTGLMFELIERHESGFADQNISELFSQLEQRNTF